MVSDNLHKENVIPVIIGSWYNAYGILRSFYAEGIRPIIIKSERSEFIDYSRFYAKLYRVKADAGLDEDAFIDELMSIGNQLTPLRGMLFPTSDNVLLALARNASILKKYYEIPFSDYETILKILDKSNFNKVCKKLGVPVIGETTIKTLKEAEALVKLNSYPVIVKPIMWNYKMIHKLGMKNFLANSAEEYEVFVRNFFSEVSDGVLLVQEYIEDSSILMPTVKSFGDKDGNIQFIYIAEKVRQYPPKTGGSLAMRAVDPEETRYKDLIEYTRKISKEFKFYGLFGIEYKYDKRIGKYKVIEMNARSEQLNYLLTLSGQNAAYQLYRYHIGEEITIPFYPKIKSAMSIVPVQDFCAAVLFNKLRYPEYALSIQDYEDSIVNPVTKYGIDFDDVKPFVYAYIKGIVDIINTYIRIKLKVSDNVKTLEYIKKFLRKWVGENNV